jgi:hypothetical protein
MTSNPTRHGRLLGACRLLWGGALVLVPGRLLGAVRAPADERSCVVARVLGGRHVLQGVVELARWPRWRRAGIAADVLHASSAVALAAADRRRRRVAVADATVAAAFALGGKRR